MTGVVTDTTSPDENVMTRFPGGVHFGPWSATKEPAPTMPSAGRIFNVWSPFLHASEVKP